MNKQREIQISKTVSWLLRHAGKKEGIPFRSDAFCKVDDLLKNKNLHLMKVTFHDLKHVVDGNDKQRYVMQEEPNKFGESEFWIKATQGHSMVFEDISLKEITDVTQIPMAIHGTYKKHLDSILKNGLSKMNRTHIHFSIGKPGEEVVSGMRTNCNVFLHLDVQKCLDDGIKLYLSENNVVLTEGVNGTLDPKYFTVHDQ